MKIKIMMIIFITIRLFSYNTLLAGDIGTSGISSLSLDVCGARQLAMGGAFTGIADDINTITCNPAGMGLLDGIEVKFMWLKWFEDSNYINANVGYKLPGSLGTLGFGFINFLTKDFNNYDTSGNLLNEKLSMNDFTMIAGYANNPLKLIGLQANLNAGLNLKYGKSDIYKISKSFIALDIGLLYQIKFINFWQKKENDTLSFGISLQNLGPTVKYINEDTELPQNLKFGIGWFTTLNRSLNAILGIDINSPKNDNAVAVNAGAEFIIAKMVSLRGGYKMSRRDMDSFSMGGGVKKKVSEYELNADYAFIPLGDFGTTHSISVGFKF